MMELIEGDCMEVLSLLPDDSVDSIVTDPPYGMAFMGKSWDQGVPGADMWEEALRVLKPGGHLLAFAGTRTQHRMACAIEDAGFEIRDMIAWVYGSGFPKSHDVAKAIDKAAGVGGSVVPRGAPVKRMIPGNDQNKSGSWVKNSGREYQPGEYVPGSSESQKWSGWGTALKPALEPITVARKPLVGTVAVNVLSYGTGALNIEDCRVGDEKLRGQKAGQARLGTFERRDMFTPDREGRWPANLIHDGSDDVLAGFPRSKGQQGFVGKKHGDRNPVNTYGKYGPRPDAAPRKDSGSSARFFYCAKASKADRNDGLAAFDSKPSAASEFRPNHKEKAANGDGGNPYGRWTPEKNNHPTVKPTALMQYLCRLVTPPGGLILDPFMGSGSTGRGALLGGFRFLGIEAESDYVAIARARISAVSEIGNDKSEEDIFS